MKQILLFAFLVVFSISYAQKPLNAPNGIKSGSKTLTPTKIGYLSNFTSDGQAQLNAKPDTSEVNLKINNINGYTAVHSVIDSLLAGTYEYNGRLYAATTTSTSLLYGKVTSYWKLDETTGNAVDVKGVESLVPTDVTQNQTGKVGQAYSFNGTTSYLGNTTNTAYAPTGAFSIIATFKSSGAAFQGIVCNYYGGLGFVLLKYNNMVYFNLNNTAVTPTNVEIEAAITSGDVWNHVVATFDGTNTIIYVNGALAATSTAWNHTIEYSPGATKFVIGARKVQDGMDLPFSGLIDDVKFINGQAVNQVDVTLDYANFVAGLPLN